MMTILRNSIGLSAEFGAGIANNIPSYLESSARVGVAGSHIAEWVSSLHGDASATGEFAAALVRDGAAPAEWLGVISILLVTDAIVPVEWSALSAPLRVALERLLASPGKRRLLSTTGRLRLSKRQ
jgi:hypothetical protein